MLKLAYEPFVHRMWQLFYIGPRWLDFITACYHVNTETEGFWQGSECNHDLHDTRPTSWEMFEFWCDDETMILDFAMRVAEVFGEELVL